MSEFLNMTIGDFLDNMAEKYPDNDALVYPKTGLRYSYREFNEVCRQAAKGFMKMGIKKGDHIAIWATNYPEWVIAQFATAKMGAVLVTVNTSYKIFELEYLMKQSDSTTLILIDGFKDSNYTGIINKLCPEIIKSEPGKIKSEKLQYLKNLIYIGSQRQPGMFLWNDLMEMGKEVSDKELLERQNSLDIHDVINMQYTSGTTGFPKGVMLTHYNVLNNGFFIGECMKFTEKDRLLIHVPLFHCFGCVLGTMASVTHGSTMVLNEFFSPGEALQIIEKEKCTAVHGVPTMFIFMMSHDDFNKYDYSSLRTGIMAGSPCPIEVMKKAIDKMGMDQIVITYGQTEASPAITMTSVDDTVEKRVSTVGKVMPKIEAKVVDPETGKDLPYGQKGELVARGYNIMKGYYKMEEATKQAIDEEGWLHTGDLATMDEEGYFKIQGRIKDMIIRGGENIYPREIEELLYTNPKVSDVQVIGVPDEKLGEEICAYIIVQEDCSLTVEEVKDFVRENMARHKVPKYVVFTDKYPLTASGKIQKYKLRDMAIEELGLQEASEIETA